MTTGRINQVTRPTFPSPQFVPGLGTLHRARHSRLWSRRRPSGYTRGGHCPTGLQTSIPHSLLGTAGDFSLERNTQERHARRAIPAASALHFLRAMLAFNRPKLHVSHRPHRQSTRSFVRPLPFVGRYQHPCGTPGPVDLHGCGTPTIDKRRPAEGSP